MGDIKATLCKIEVEGKSAVENEVSRSLRVPIRRQLFLTKPSP